VRAELCKDVLDKGLGTEDQSVRKGTHAQALRCEIEEMQDEETTGLMEEPL